MGDADCGEMQAALRARATTEMQMIHLCSQYESTIREMMLRFDQAEATHAEMPDGPRRDGFAQCLQIWTGRPKGE